MNHGNIWFPYTQMKNTPIPFLVESASGCYIKLKNGIKLLDGISSWWSVCHGYNHPYIQEKIANQLAKLPHVMFSGLAHEQAYKLSSRLAKISPGSCLTKVFFSDSGSTAVEVAMKIATQYYKNLGNFQRNKFIFFNNSYHGDTMGCMSISDPEKIHGSSFDLYKPSQYMLKLPENDQEIKSFISQVNSLKEYVAAIIIEPILQAAGGMKIHSPFLLKQIYDIANQSDILFIADEIATGFGRIGSMFGCDQAKIVPDIMTIGKGLTGGFCTLGATLVTEKVYDSFLSEDNKNALMHGPTFMANPLACSAANASLDLFLLEPRLEQVSYIEKQLKSDLKNFNTLTYIKDIRIKGAVGVIELDKKITNINDKLLNLGIWIKPISNIIYVMPPFTITKDQLSFLTSSLYKLIKSI